ncbi:hypothetical protein [Arthrobacter pascens]|uniref:hypothetical protein n=1 Tax=Arthrobacter pascens TaxID=1677 RepID=UPI0027D7B784|nr:hypothetical protein [Arthrobacter pascens]
MITLQRRQLVGHDILLARHGNHICSMRLDRGNGRVVALLDDGSVDSAPNLISPGLRLPDTLQSVLREDWKLFAGLSAAAAGLGCLMVAAASAYSSSMVDPEMVQLLSAYSAY